jgi:hypothetical protein
MKFSLIPRSSQTRRWLTHAASALLIVSVAGCASPGPPHAPSLNLPEPVKDLTAERVGDKVILHWTTPEKTTDRLAIKGAITAEICRISVPVSSATTPACAAVTRVMVQSGASRAEDLLPASLTVDPVSLVAYRVQLFNPNGRSAGLSSEAFAAAGAAPPTVQQLRAKPLRDGIELEWQQENTTSQVLLDRQLVEALGVFAKPISANPASTSKPATRPRFRKTSPPAAFAKPKAQPISSQKTPGDVKLETPKESKDAGGTIDQSTLKSASYRYTAQRVREISLAGHTLTLRSDLSAPVTVAMLDTFAPAVPTGLEAVPGGAAASDRSIDLSWVPNTDTDLAGYIVYRQEVTSTGQVAGPATRLNQSPIVGPAYRDQTAIPGHRYAYRITAVDATGNESAPSVEVQETLREP